MSSTINPLPLPYAEPIVQKRNWKRYPKPQDLDPNEGLIGQRFLEYLDQQSVVSAAAAVRLNAVSLLDQAVSIGDTDLAPGSMPAGLYEIRCYARIVQAATTSSALTITLTWTHRGVTVIDTFGAVLNGNTVQTTRNDRPKMIRVDNATPILYSTTYASVGATPMKYDLDLVLSRVQA